MKKIILTLVISAILSACTSQEDNLKIMEFWNKQVRDVQMKVMSKILERNMKAKGIMPEMFASTQEATAGTHTAAFPTNFPTAPAVAAKGGKQTVAQDPVTAKLFLSDSCGWCKKLKQSGFPEKFKNKYADEVDLQIYEVHSAQGKREFAAAVKKHKLSGGVPLLIIGNSVIAGYSDNMMALADEKVRIELKKRGPIAPAGPAVVSITMEDSAVSGPASEADKIKMKNYLSRVQDNNEATLESMRNMFSKQVWNQTLALVTNTENRLKQTANQSATYEEFLQAAKPLEQAQQQKIDDLVRQNVKNIR